MDDRIKRDSLIEQLQWLSISCTTLTKAVQQENPDVSLGDLSDMLDQVVPSVSDFMSACFGDGEDE